VVQGGQRGRHVPLRRRAQVAVRRRGGPGPAGRDTIAYCRIGERSAHTWFVLHELLGLPNVKNYDGSWTEYGSLVGVPIELGEAR
jgi:3-mercaptopyruvate sulfurtransferase SseA